MEKEKAEREGYVGIGAFLVLKHRCMGGWSAVLAK
jgi:hypothetical protein